MSNLKVGDRVRHSVFGAKGTIVSTHKARAGFLYLIVRPDEPSKSSDVWISAFVKPIVTVRR